MGRSNSGGTPGESGTVLTYDLHAGADYLKFKEELGATFLGMRETRLLTTVVWDDLDLDIGGLRAYIHNHRDVAGFIIVKGFLIG